MSVIVTDASVAATTASTTPAIADTGVATITSSAPAQASTNEPATRSTQPRSSATAASAGSKSNPVTCAPACSRRARPRLPPIRPRPAIATCMADLPTGRPAGDSEQALDVGDERAELRRGNLLGRIGQGVLRRRMRLHDQAISASGDSSHRKGHHE